MQVRGPERPRAQVRAESLSPRTAPLLSRPPEAAGRGDSPPPGRAGLCSTSLKDAAEV